jgi:hypothetical protein
MVVESPRVGIGRPDGRAECSYAGLAGTVR